MSEAVAAAGLARWQEWCAEPGNILLQTVLETNYYDAGLMLPCFMLKVEAFGAFGPAFLQEPKPVFLE